MSKRKGAIEISCALCCKEETRCLWNFEEFRTGKALLRFRLLSVRKEETKCLGELRRGKALLRFRLESEISRKKVPRKFAESSGIPCPHKQPKGMEEERAHDKAAAEY